MEENKRMDGNKEIQNIARCFLTISKNLRAGQFTKMEMEMIIESCNAIIKATDNAMLKKEGDENG